MKVSRISQKEITVKRADTGEALIVEGYAAVYDSDSKNLFESGKSFVERIERGAFLEATNKMDEQSRDCVATFQHDRTTMLARTSSGTLELESDDIGLKFRFSVPNTSIGNDVAVMLERGDLKQCSFVATVAPDDLTVYRDDSGIWRQDIKRFDAIYDISLVIDPAYGATSFTEVERSILSLEEKENKVKEQENALKESQKTMLNNLITRVDEN